MTENIAFYTVAQIAKFVPPVSVRVESNEVAGLEDVAFQRPDGRLVILVANEGEDERSFVVTRDGRKKKVATLPGHAVATIVW